MKTVRRSEESDAPELAPFKDKKFMQLFTESDLPVHQIRLIYKGWLLRLQAEFEEWGGLDNEGLSWDTSAKGDDHDTES